MKLTLLGTGTPTPSLKRMGSGYLLKVGHESILFDHGPGAYHRLMETGVSPTDVTHLFLSHLHYDHCLDLQRLVLTRWDQGAGKVPELKVYGPPPTARMVELLFSEDGVWAPDLTARTQNELSLDVYRQRGGELPRNWPCPDVKEIRHGTKIEEENWVVDVAEVIHVPPHLTSCGFRLTAKDGVVAYSGDTGWAPAMEDLARESDVLIHMCHMLSGTAPSKTFAKGCMGHRELAKLANQANVKNLVLTHVTNQIDQPGIREKVVREISENYDGNIFFGEDLMEIPIEGPNAPKLD